MDKPAMTPMQARNLLILADSYVLGRNRRAIAATIEGMEAAMAAMRQVILDNCFYEEQDPISVTTIYPCVECCVAGGHLPSCSVGKALASDAGAPLLAELEAVRKVAETAKIYRRWQIGMKGAVNNEYDYRGLFEAESALDAALAAYRGGGGK